MFSGRQAEQAERGCRGPGPSEALEQGRGAGCREFHDSTYIQQIFINYPLVSTEILLALPSTTGLP